MPTNRIAYLEPVPDEVESIIRSRLPPGLDLHVRGKDETVESAIADADFVVVATSPLPAHSIAAGLRLRLIQCRRWPAACR